MRTGRSFDFPKKESPGRSANFYRGLLISKNPTNPEWKQGSTELANEADEEHNAQVGCVNSGASSSAMTVTQKSPTVTWLSTEFSVYDPKTTTWHDVPGIYIFTGINSRNQWVAYYVGQAKSFAVRLADHERWKEAARLGATHIHAAVVQLAASRDLLEQTLIASYQPPLNTHYR